MADQNAVPNYLPARMLNEYVYCPRLFHFEWVEGLFVQSADTVEGALRHKKLDKRTDGLPPPAAAGGEDFERLHSRSVTLSSDEHRVIAKMDLIEAAGGAVVPVDYKRGSPPDPERHGGREVWDTDRAQLAAQAIVLRDNGYRCEEGVVYYSASRKRVKVAFDDALIAETVRRIEEARRVAAADGIPAPLDDSPKCPRCSLVGICLPDETRWVRSHRLPKGAPGQLLLFDDRSLGSGNGAGTGGEAEEVRRLVPARDDLRPLYLNTQGLRVGKSGGVLQARRKGELVEEIRVGETSQVNLFGNIQVTTQAIQALLGSEIPLAFFSMGGWFYGLAHGLGLKNIFLRRDQYRLAQSRPFSMEIARALVVGKILNQRTLLKRNHPDPPRRALSQLRSMAEQARRARAMQGLLGIEGMGARIYYENFAPMIKVKEAQDGGDVTAGEGEQWARFDFNGRNRRPPRDPVNALLSLAYSLLAKDLTIICYSIGFEPFLGFYHQPRFGRPALALDLMEPFRPIVADSVVLTAINNRMVTPRDFVRAGDAVALKPEGRKAFFRAYERRMDQLVTHPLFDYRVSYRRILEIQARLLGRVLTGEMSEYSVFTTR